jgi:hypothetical protein
VERADLNVDTCGDSVLDHVPSNELECNPNPWWSEDEEHEPELEPEGQCIDPTIRIGGVEPAEMNPEIDEIMQRLAAGESVEEVPTIDVEEPRSESVLLLLGGLEIEVEVVRIVPHALLDSIMLKAAFDIEIQKFISAE